MNLKKINTDVLIISIATIVGTFLFAYVAYVLHRGDIPETFISMWNTWDTQHYIKIATHGYSDRIIDDRNLLIAFFPLFPLLTKIVSYIFQDLLLSGLIVSNISYVIGVFYLYKLVLIDFEKDDALRAIIYFSVFPTAFFLHAAYTESLFLALTIASFYYARNENWAVAGLLGMLSALTRITGIIILPILLIEYLHQKDFKRENIRKDILWIFVVGLGFLIYLLINYDTFGDPLKFLEIQSDYWGMELSLPTTGFMGALSYFSRNDLNNEIYQGWFQISFGLTGLALIIYSFFRIRLSYSLYALVTWLVVTSTSFMLSVPRFILTIFPIFIVMAILGRNKVVNYCIIFISILFYALLLSLFVQFKWAF